ncbi:hypothetical protein QQ045_015910 [Rhodiola kirilowii]
MMTTKNHVLCCGYSNQERGRCGNNIVASCTLEVQERKTVCVTTGNSILSSHIIKELLTRGYLIRVTLQNQEDFEDMRELVSDNEMNQLERVVVAKMGDVDDLCEAFRGCHAIFHTSSFIDPHGVSGYSESMAFLETEAATNVIEACGRTAYLKRCIFTSSLLASIWQGNDFSNEVVDETCWSNEDFCRENKLWMALGKTRAEKAAWRKAKEMKVNLISLCPGLLLSPSIPITASATCIPYLKGSQTMLQRGLLAVDDFENLAKAHVNVYEEMDYGACGRYLTFESVVKGLDEAREIQDQLKAHGLGPINCELGEHGEKKSSLTNAKLMKLVARASNRISSCR